MRAQRVCFYGAGGNLHTEFFGSWLRSAFDYPRDLNGKELARWREAQPVYGEIHGSLGVEGQA
jgi:hypothetical protein